MDAVASRIAKKGTESDISLHDKREGDIALSIAIPRTYPERIQPLLQCLSMSDSAVFFPESADSTVGEEIVAMSAFSRPGVIVAYEDLGGKLLDMLGRRVGGWTLIPRDGSEEKRLWEHLSSLEPARDSGREHWRVDVDHSFDVKGVGTVCLGIVRYGTARVHDKIIAQPSGKEGMVRSIQIFDVDHKEAPAGSRVGFAVKGLTTDDMPRGTVITNNMHFATTRAVRVALRKEAYFKEPLESGKIMHICAGLQCRQARIIGVGDAVELESEEPLAIEEEEALLFSAKPPGQLRIAGRGPVSPLLS